MAISLESISRGKRMRAPKVVVYGGAKIGKSTFASGIPGVVFIQTEEGLDALDVAAFPMAGKFQDVLDALDVLATQDHDFRAVAVDSLDWTEALLHRQLCQMHNVKTIEQVGGGYGKGYVEALGLWRQMLERLDYLRNQRGMAVILIAHDEWRKMEPPDSEPYSYAALKLHKSAAALVEEWSDCIGYATEPTFTKKDDLGFNKKHTRAIGSSQRILVVGNNPAYVTGNRYGLPMSVPLDWNEFVSAVMHATGSNPAPAQAA
jgi:hypothetical protein